MNTKNILLVEDEYEERMALCDSLRGWGFDVTAVGNGAGGLAKIETNDYHLVISDVRMPKMDGIELLGKIKEQRNDQGTKKRCACHSRFRSGDG
jgi:CheY-like chemotaxis protein